MKKFKEKLAELGVLEQFEANLERSNEVNGFDADFITKYMSREADNTSKLLDAFSWNDTPEGFAFWLGVYFELLHDSNEKFKEKLKELGVLDKFEANLEKSNEANGFDPDLITEEMSMRISKARKLMWAFKWDDTPEGFDFWLKVYDKLEANL